MKGGEREKREGREKKWKVKS